MDVAAREVLFNNRTLLLKNIVPCEELFNKLKQQRILSDFMLGEIKVRQFNKWQVYLFCLNNINMQQEDSLKT